MRTYVNGVRRDWKEHWEGRLDHRYGRDFHAFLGERILTDFDLADLDIPVAVPAREPTRE